ncbi:prolipoprotein diacylglyceryl transferase [Anoxynatronum sibiricum]|uniref:Phosphatidylglycerol--prolipoprotein diacylglyceryl transferase n=1 Tax=Anoxynatronum sibiricum TaxID=210623 RepID=A0ABU9VRP3_9CLOT
MDRVAFTIFGIEVAWYGMLIAMGMLLGVLLAVRRTKAIGVQEDIMYDIALWSIPAGVIGARIYYVIFNWAYYSQDLIRILQFRQGGLAIHGGIIAGFVTGYFLCLKHGVSFPAMADVTAPSMILGQAIGRWGNYFNQEAYGRPTELPWAIIIDGVGVHPTFLYESIWNFLVMGWLLFYTDRKKVDGEVFLHYLILYSVGRFFIEGLRTDSLMIGPLRTAQVVSLLMIIVGLVGVKWLRYQNKHAHGHSESSNEKMMDDNDEQQQHKDK